ncbi:hypothetical protein B0T09DRAFT_333416 [Sordaria sp. MPI-SDFR-AT-0083]|nr:hypothetical protein B0T09DRAFT_333416 [Sordaria sp. MPI-SDFR-AT-0083]
MSLPQLSSPSLLIVSVQQRRDTFTPQPSNNINIILSTMPSRTQISPPQLISNPKESHQSSIIACAVITWSLSALFVGLRFYTRGFLLKGKVLGAEDWVLLVALVMSGLTSGGLIEQAIYGLGKHALDVDPALVIPMGKAGWYTILYYMLSLLFTKISILLLYIRILSYQHARYLVYLILGIVVATNGVWTLYTVVTACDPLWAFWDPASVSIPFRCRGVAYWYANTGLHIGTDLLLYILPLPVLVKLKVGWGRKIGLFLVLGLGGLVCLVSTIRLWDLVAEASRPDFTFDNVSIAYLTCSEVNGAVVVACCMTLKPFFDRISTFWCLERLRLTKSDSSGKSDVVDSDVEAQHFCKQSPRKMMNLQGVVSPKGKVGDGPPTIGSTPTRPMVMAMAQCKRRGSWSWLYTSSSQSRWDEGDLTEANETSERGNALSVNAIECDAVSQELSPVSPVLSTGSEASWKSEETVTTKLVTMCPKVS